MIPEDVLSGMVEAFRKAEGGHTPSMREAVAAAEKMGWKLVPREPTRVMLRAARDQGGCFSSNFEQDCEPYGDTWAVMVDAA